MAAAYMEVQKTLVFRASGPSPPARTQDPPSRRTEDVASPSARPLSAQWQAEARLAKVVRLGPGITLNCVPFAGDTNQYGH